jgi:hypothetical protein
MTMPDDGGLHAMLGQVLAKQGEQGVQLAVIIEQLKDIPDHEQRIRSLERWRWGLPASVLASVAAVVAAWLTYAHR